MAALVGLLISGAVRSGSRASNPDSLNGPLVWEYATLLVIGYAVSRGLSKSGAGTAQQTSAGGRGAPDH